MNARPEVMPILVEKRMKKWLAIIRCPLIARKCTPARARRNLIRLLSRYPEIAERKFNLTIPEIYSL